MTVLTKPASTRDLHDAEPAKAFASGAAPYRALLLGSGPDGGTLAEELAQRLAARTGHGIDVEALPARPLADVAAQTLLSGRDLSRLDTVIVFLDPEQGASVSKVRDAFTALLAELGSRLTIGAALSVVVPAPRASALGARELDAVALVARETVDSLTPVVHLEDVQGATEEERIAHWADQIAEATAAALIDPLVGVVPDDHYDEDLRLDAVDRLPPRDGLWVAQFQRIVDDAREAYGTEAAAMSIIDADFARYGVSVGFENKSVRRGQTICNRVIRTYGGLIVGDARLDLRFQRNPDVRSGEVRFYAGYRIESEDGAPLGSLCVFDPNPRDEVAEQDLVRLRDLAIEAQRRIWAFQRAAAA